MTQLQPQPYRPFDDEEEINIQEIIRIILQGKWIIIFSFIIVVAVTTWYTFTTPPVYEASTLLLIEKTGSSAATGIFEMSPFGANQMKVNNELEILKSRTIAERTIRSLHEKYAQDSLFVLGGRVADKKKTINWTKMIKEWILTLGNQPVDIEEEDPSFDEKIRAMAENFQQNVTVSTIRETQAIRVTVQNRSPFEAALVTNTLAKEYYDMDLERSRGAMGEVTNFLEEQLVDVEKKLAASEDTLQSYQQVEGVVNLDENSRELINKLSDFESILYTAEAEKQINKKQLDYLTEKLGVKEKELLTSLIQTANPLILQLQMRIASLESDLVELVNTGYTESSVQYQEINRQLESFKTRLNSETQRLIDFGYIPGPNDPMAVNQTLLQDIVRLQTEAISLEAKTKEYQRLVDFYDREIDKLPRKIISFARLERDRQVNEKIYLLMKQRYEESRITEASQIGNVHVIDKAVPPKYPIKPKKKMNLLLGGFLGLGLGVGIIFIREFMDNTVKSKEDLVKLGFTVLGLVPQMDKKEVRRKAARKMAQQGQDGDASQFQNRLIINIDPKSPISEAYRTLRTNVELSRPDGTVKSMVITSSGPGEGKSTTIANLTLAYAQLGYKTILCDADLRKPVMHKLFGIKRVPGLVDLVLERATLEEVIHPSDIENLYLLPAGNLPPNPSELLGSKRMKEVLAELKERFEKIFFDAPPVIAVTDATVLGASMDGMIFVVNSGNTFKELVSHSKSLMDQSKMPLLGCVVNNVSPNNMSGSYYYYHKYYHYKY
jgi:capsular exopolysaccharide synthesis family protein